MCRRCVGWRALMPRRDAAGWRSSTCSEPTRFQPADAGAATDLDALAPPKITGGPLTPVWQTLSGSEPLAGSGAPTGMAIENGVITVAYEDGAVKALDAATGAPRRESKLRRASLVGAGGSVAGLVLVGGEDGAVHALDAADGRPRRRHQTVAPIYAAPTVTEVAIYAPSAMVPSWPCRHRTASCCGRLTRPRR